MVDYDNHDQIIAKIQHFAELMQQCIKDKEMWLLTLPPEHDCEQEKVKEQILVLQEMLKEYYKIFDDILYR